MIWEIQNDDDDSESRSVCRPASKQIKTLKRRSHSYLQLRVGDRLGARWFCFGTFFFSLHLFQLCPPCFGSSSQPASGASPSSCHRPFHCVSSVLHPSYVSSPCSSQHLPDAPRSFSGRSSHPSTTQRGTQGTRPQGTMNKGAAQCNVLTAPQRQHAMTSGWTDQTCNTPGKTQRAEWHAPAQRDNQRVVRMAKYMYGAAGNDGAVARIGVRRLPCHSCLHRCELGGVHGDAPKHQR